jgi:hypothetical protein
MADKPFIQWLHSQPCAMQPCGAAVQAHHSTNAPAERHGKSLGGRRGKSQRPDDAHAFALCLRHHAQFHDASGPFRDWTREKRRAWQDEQVAAYRDRYELEVVLNGGPLASAAPSCVPTPAITNDPKAIAQQFCAERGLGDQVAFDLERLLRSLERRVVG